MVNESVISSGVASALSSRDAAVMIVEGFMLLSSLVLFLRD
jgi:hypothetical protein